MAVASVWDDLRERCEALDPESVIVTPVTERPFRLASTTDDRIIVKFVETDEERTLWRTQFEVLIDRIDPDSEGVSVSDLRVGVEPYVSVLSLSSQYAVDESRGVLRRSESGESEESPYVRPEWTVRQPPERLHDDAVLLADMLHRHDDEPIESLPVGVLVDLYVLLSDVQRGADRLRKDVGEVLLEYVGPDDRLHSQFGTVHRTVREYNRLKDEETILDAIDEEGIPREWVLGVDPDKLDVVLAVTDLDKDDVYNTDEQVYIQKTGVEEAEKQSRLQGLKDRLEEIDETEAEELQSEIESLEERLDTLLAAG